MIADLQRFARSEEPYWRELSGMLDALDADAARTLSYGEAQRLHYLYERAAGALGRLSGLPENSVALERLEPLVARAYAEIHETRAPCRRARPLRWFFGEFPRAFRRRAGAFALSLALTLAGAAAGGALLLAAPDAKEVLVPFAHIQGDPADRVAWEEENGGGRDQGGHGAFAAMLMTHNTRVSIFTLALGVTFGLGSAVMLFYNGIILGVVALDYARAGQAVFLTGWLLPHGSVEIPAILIAGQAAFVLAAALIGRNRPESLRARLRAAAPDTATLITGVAVLLVWAGVVEAFFSQYHEPALPYLVKILFGAAQLAALAAFLGWSGRRGGGGAGDA